MDNLFELKVVTPMGYFYEGRAKMVELTTTDGNVGIYKEHIPLTAVIAPGELRIHEEDTVKTAALMSGFIEILKDKITIMAEVCEWPEDIDENRAREAMERAQRRLNQKDNIDIARAELALKRALVRLEVKH